MAKTRVLIVEDEGPVALSLQELLESMGYEVPAVAVTGEEAVWMASSLKPDVVLMDIRLRGNLDGVEAAEQIRSHAGAPVIYLTANADPATVARAQRTEPFGFLLKPFRERELRTCIEMAVYKYRAEQQLRASERRYAATVQSMGEALITVDGQGRVTLLNPVAESLTGWTQAEAAGRPLSEVFQIIHDQTRQPLAPPVAQALTERKPIGLANHALLLARDGREIPVEDSAALIEEAGSGVQGAVLVFRDISARRQAEEERRRLEAQMLQAQKLESLGVMAGGIAHDFNNLLTSVLGYADLALEDIPPESPARAYIQQAILAARRAAELTRQMLAYTGKAMFDVRPLNLSLVVQDMADLLKVSLSKKCALHCDLARDLPAIQADAAQVRQVVLNLVLNAAEAIGEQSGAIVLRTGVLHADRRELAGCQLGESLSEGPYVALEVTDTGSGITTDNLARIFDPFFTTKFTGRGLGLAAVLGIMRGHRGAIKVTSVVGRGATFRVLFPVADSAAEGPRAAAEEVPPWHGSGTVLVVDDEPMVRDIARRLLESIGLTVLTAADGSEAVAVFRANADRIRLVLLDLLMPGLDGVETLRELRRIKPEIPVVLCSGYGEAHAAERVAEEKQVTIVEKPYRLEALRQAVRQALQPQENPQVQTS